MPFKIRRIVTSHDANGKAVVGMDEIIEAKPGVMDKRVSNAWIWSTDSMPPELAGPDPLLKQPAVLPGPNGTIFRILELPPQASAHMHKTETIDYVLVLEGETVMLLDDDAEVQMKQGDVMVQRGTYHGWANRTDSPCKIAFILIDAKKK